VTSTSPDPGGAIDLTARMSVVSIPIVSTTCMRRLGMRNDWFGREVSP
jgi:hypothetical protein